MTKMETLSSVKVSISFECGDCECPAKMVEVDGAIDRVFCPSCGTEVDGRRAHDMIDTLRLRHIKQEGSNVMRREVNKRRMGRVPLRNVANEFSDPRWPFVMKIESDR